MMTLLLTSPHWRATKDMTTGVGKNNLGWGWIGRGGTEKETAMFLQLGIEITEMGNSKKMTPLTIYSKRSLCCLPQKRDKDT